MFGWLSKRTKADILNIETNEIKQKETNPSMTTYVTTSSSDEKRLQIQQFGVKVEQLAIAKYPDIVKEQPTRLEKFNNVHATDVKNFGLSCKKFGNFLSLDISRLVDPLKDVDNNVLGQSLVPEKFSTTLNLMNCREIKLVGGCLPNNTYIANFGFKNILKEGVYFSSGVNINDPVEVYVSQPNLKVRNIFVLWGDNSNFESGGVPYYNAYSKNTPYYINFRAYNIASPSEDDRIIFDQIGTLYVPAGMGSNILKKILMTLNQNK